MNDESFFSIDKLIEFGIGVSLARQMINTMNVCMAQSNIPSVKLQVPTMPKLAVEWYTVIEEQVVGPFSDEELKSLILKQRVSEETLVWRKGMDGWTLAKSIPDVYRLILLNK